MYRVKKSKPLEDLKRRLIQIRKVIEEALRNRLQLEKDKYVGIKVESGGYRGTGGPQATQL